MRTSKRKTVAEDGFDPSTSELWAHHAPTAPLCYFTHDNYNKYGICIHAYTGMYMPLQYVHTYVGMKSKASNLSLKPMYCKGNVVMKLL